MEPKNKSIEEEKPLDKKTYSKPAVIYQAELEVRAGTPLSLPGDPFGLDILGE
jgi:hypothetical protein